MTAGSYIVSRRDGVRMNVTLFLSCTPDVGGGRDGRCWRWSPNRANALRCSRDAAHRIAEAWNEHSIASKWTAIQARVEDLNPPPPLVESAR